MAEERELSLEELAEDFAVKGKRPENKPFFESELQRLRQAWDEGKLPSFRLSQLPDLAAMQAGRLAAESEQQPNEIDELLINSRTGGEKLTYSQIADLAQIPISRVKSHAHKLMNDNTLPRLTVKPRRPK